jgi:CcdB protein
MAMALQRYDVLHNNGRNQTSLPCFIVLQSEYSRTSELVIVAPIFAADYHGALISKIHISIEIEAMPMVISLEEFGAISARNLGKNMGNFSQFDCEIGKGLDFLLKGI